MDKTAFQFLTGVLGTDGAKALQRAVTKQPELASVLVPRTVLGWLGLQKSEQYEGGIPGVTNSYLRFTKTESGWEGAVSLSEAVYKFAHEDNYALAAAISLALGFDNTKESLSDFALMRLGKSIDALLKAHDLTQKLTLAEPPGQTAKPFEQNPPEEPVAPQKQPKMKPKLPKIATLKVEKSEARKECPVCGGQRFADNRFVGCLCWRDMAKSIKTTAYADGYVLESNDREALMALSKDLK